MPVRPITFKVNLLSGRAMASTTTTLPAQADVSARCQGPQQTRYWRTRARSVWSLAVAPLWTARLHPSGRSERQEPHELARDRPGGEDAHIDATKRRRGLDARNRRTASFASFIGEARTVHRAALMDLA